MYFEIDTWNEMRDNTFYRFQIFFFILFVLLVRGKVHDDKKLLAVSIVYRHGDRVPLHFYRNDPFGNPDLWPTGPGQLTNVGKRQHYQLGKWFRKRYDGFLSSVYDKDEIRVISSDDDRCVMSALANLAGLFPPVAGDIWKSDLKWQPIPVHTIPKEEDGIAGSWKSCPRYLALLAAEKLSPHYLWIDIKYSLVYAHLEKHTGEIITLPNCYFIYDTLHIEEMYNFTLPAWTKSVYPKHLKELFTYMNQLFFYTDKLTELMLGQQYYQIRSQFHALARNRSRFEKMRMYSTHDVTIFGLLKSLGVTDSEEVPYAAALIFELYQLSSDQIVVELLYKKNELVTLAIPKCGTPCEIERFLDLIEPYSLSLVDWQEQCKIL